MSALTPPWWQWGETANLQPWSTPQHHSWRQQCQLWHGVFTGRRLRKDLAMSCCQAQESTILSVIATAGQQNAAPCGTMQRRCWPSLCLQGRGNLTVDLLNANRQCQHTLLTHYNKIRHSALLLCGSWASTFGTRGWKEATSVLETWPTYRFTNHK